MSPTSSSLIPHPSSLPPPPSALPSLSLIPPPSSLPSSLPSSSLTPHPSSLPPDVVLSVRSVYKKFSRNLKRTMWYGMVDLGRNLIGVGTDRRQGDERVPVAAPALDTTPATEGHARAPLRRDEFWAVNDISFDLKKGEILGLIGANGSGKSTLLRVITGIFPPDKGIVAIRGRLSALIALGAGFHSHMSGRENIYLNATVLGLTRKEIDEKFDAIAEFADIGEFLDAPVSTYSSGMTVRLGFAIAVHSLTDIVLIDEILAVGDAQFQRKCIQRISTLRRTGTAFIVVSHNMQNIEAMCQRVLLLDHGCVTMIGPTEQIVPHYELMQMRAVNGSDPQPPRRHADLDAVGLQHLFSFCGYGTDDVRIESVRIIDDHGALLREVVANESISVQIQLFAPIDLADVYLWLVFRHVEDPNDREKDVASVGVRVKTTLGKGRSIVRFPFDGLQFATGLYKISFCIFDETFLNPYSQGHYGYFTVKNPIPTLLRTGQSAPFLWLRSAVTIRASGADECCAGSR